MNRKLIIAVVLTVLAALAVTVGRCEDPERKRLEATIARLVASVEMGDSEVLSEIIAVDYTDRLGHDHRSVVRRILAAVEHIPEVHIELAHLSLQIDKKTGYATATFLPVFHGDIDLEKKTRPKYEFQKGKRLLIRFRKHGDRWLVVRGDMTMSITGAL